MDNVKQNGITKSLKGNICAPESEMSRLIHNFDWSTSKLGPISKWPSVLRFSLSLILNSQQPIWIGWGEELILFYNDAYIQILGAKHPMALGKPTKEVWDNELWVFIAPWVEKVKRLEPVFISNYRFFSTPFDYLQEDYCSFSYNPLLDESNQFRGVICPLTMNTDKLVGERRSKTISNLSKSLIEKSEEAACSSSLKILSENRDDVPFALLYLIKKDGLGTNVILQNSYGIEGKFDHINPSVINIRNNRCFWPISEVLKTKSLKVISVKELTELPLGLAKQPISLAVIQPLYSGSENPLGVLITGVNPCWKLDKSFRSFFELVAGQINTSILNAQNCEAEKRQMEMLSEIDRAKTLFFTNVSHELRTPLSLMLSPLEDILSDPKLLTENQHKQLDLVHRNSLRLLKLVNSLLDFSRIEANRMQAIFEPTNLPLLTSNLASVFRSIIEKANLEYYVDTHDFNVNEIVYIDHEMWEKIIFNLLSNAFKFTLKGSIKLSLKSKNGYAITKIKDTGVGIPESELPRIFERFRRVEGTLGRSFEGTGIGLALTNELVKYHGGQLSAKSTFGKGSTFTVSIPLSLDHLSLDKHVVKRNSNENGRMGNAFIAEASRWVSESSSSSSSSSDVSPDSSPKHNGVTDHLNLSSIPVTSPPNFNFSSLKARILIADDNADMREYLRSLLEKEKYCKEVITVKDGKTAYKTAVKMKPDIILCDVMMPKLDGFGLLKELKRNSETHLIPFIMLSARAGEEAKIQGLQAGADDYLVKPFSSKELVTRVEAHLKFTNIRKESYSREKELFIEAQSAKNNLENVLQNLKEGFIVLNDQWEIVYLNVTMATMFRKRREDLVGKNLFEVFPESQELKNDMIYAKEEKVSVINEFYYPPCERWYENRILPHTDGICIFSTDISSRRRLEIEKKNAIELANQHQQQRIIEADEYRRKQAEFIDTLCHELRNPLNGIYGGVSLLNTDLKELIDNVNSLSSLSEENSQSVERIHQALRKLEETLTAVDQCAKQQKVIVDDVLDLSKLDNNKVELNAVPFRPADIIESALQMFHPQLSQKKLNVTTNVDPREMRLIADPFRLTQIITNLLSNGIKFTPDKGDIRVEAHLENNNAQQPVLRVSVADTGIGMNFEEKKKLFDRFAQANNRTTTEFGGSGLGLAISKTLVEAMGGTIDVVSEKEKGSTFIFTIRCEIAPEKKDDHVARDRDSYSPKPQRNPNEISILIAEDNMLNQKIICRFLEQKGYKFSVANNGQEALNLFQSRNFDLIFMDIEMPILNGLQATKQIRSIEQLSSKQSIPVIGVSGNVSDKQIQCALDSGMNDYLKKPYSRDQVFRAIDQHLLSSIHC